MAAIVREDDRVERRAARVTATDADGHPTVIGAGRPADRVRGELSSGADELTEGPPIHAARVWRRPLEQALLDDLDFHATDASPWRVTRKDLG